MHGGLITRISSLAPSFQTSPHLISFKSSKLFNLHPLPFSILYPLTLPTVPPLFINISNAIIKLSFTTQMDTIMTDPLPETLTSGFNGMPIFPGFVLQSPNIINLDSDDGNSSDTTLLGDTLVERTRPVSKARQKRRRRRIDAVRVRAQPRTPHPFSLSKYSYDGRTLKLGTTVEMMDGAFLRIKTILEDRETGEIFLKGIRFQRISSLEDLLELKLNEVVLMMEHDPDHHLINLAAVVNIRELIMTNLQYPALSVYESNPDSAASGVEYESAHSRLLCRWKYLKTSKDKGVLKRLIDSESDEGCSIPQSELRSRFRGRTIKGGMSPGWLEEEIAFEREQQARSRNLGPLQPRTNLAINEATSRKYERRYTLGDAFCGGGGVSSGGQMAGFRVEEAFDKDRDAVATYRLNFPHARCHCVSVYNFVTSINRTHKYDHLHMSPPCAPFSPLHNRPFPNDEDNQAAFLAVEMLLRKTTPRTVTLEETFGLTRGVENLEWFTALIQIFTRLGFSVRWNVFNFLDFGVSQPRRRLIIFASW